MEHLQSEIVHPQIVCHEIEKERSSLPAKRARLEYLQLNKQKPKSIPTFAPLIEDDFLIAGHWKERQLNDQKVLKRKIKKTEKDAQRELKKDTQVIM